MASIICLILSAATGDEKCIEATGDFARAGHLDVEKLAAADPKVIEKLIEKCGIPVGASKIIDMAKDVMDNHVGVIPCDHGLLVGWSCVGRKMAGLMLADIFGFF